MGNCESAKQKRLREEKKHREEANKEGKLEKETMNNKENQKVDIIKENDNAEENKDNKLDANIKNENNDSFQETYNKIEELLEKANELKKKNIKIATNSHNHKDNGELKNYNHQKVISSGNFEEILTAIDYNKSKLIKYRDSYAEKAEHDNAVLENKEIQLRNVLNSITLLKL